MASSPDSISMALFCDFENVALGVRDAKYEKFDIKRVLERLLLKGSIVVKKAYCDWDRYKSFKAAMHEANFELIEIPHVRQSGKNSADIRLVVDALDLCYTKSHVDTFVIISGDSDFSPLVSKLRENAKQVIGVGVKQSTSDLLIANCDEFIFYDDLVRDSQRAAAKREARDNPPASRKQPEEDKARREELESRRSKAIDIAVETFDALLAERGESGKIWSSMLKEAMKRRKPDFNESHFGFRSFGNLLEEAANRGLLGFGRDDKGAYVFRAPARAALADNEAPVDMLTVESVAIEDVEEQSVQAETVTGEAEASGTQRRRGGRRGRNGRDRERVPASDAAVDSAPLADTVVPAEGLEVAETTVAEASDDKPRRGARRGRGKERVQQAAEGVTEQPPLEAAPVLADAAQEPAPESKPGRGGRRPRKAVAADSAPETKPVADAAVDEAKPAKAKRTARPRKPKAADTAEG